MGYAERIYEQVKQLPSQEAKEVLDFAEFVAKRRALVSAPVAQSDHARRRAAVEETFAKYHVDFGCFKFNRKEANARH